MGTYVYVRGYVEEDDDEEMPENIEGNAFWDPFKADKPVLRLGSTK